MAKQHRADGGAKPLAEATAGPHIAFNADLLAALREVEKAISRLFEPEGVYKQICDEIAKELGYDFAALQLKSPDEQTIETVAGRWKETESRKEPECEWVGRSKHPLEKDHRLRDIQADLAQPYRDNQPDVYRVEVIAGEDDRFDKGVFDAFGHKDLVRAFVPLFVVQDQRGNVLSPQELERWLAGWKHELVKDWQEGNGQHRVATITVPERDANGKKLTFRVIGTIETGYEDIQKQIHWDEAIDLAKLAAKKALRIQQTLLPSVLSSVAHQARLIVSADYATLHFDRAEREDKYVYNVESGFVSEDYLTRHLPRKDGLGQLAIDTGEPQFVPDKRKGHLPNHLQDSNPGVWGEGIRAMAAIPLQKKGVLYICFEKFHDFTPGEIGLMELFAGAALDAIHHATMYTQERDRGRRLKNLQSVVHFLVSKPDDPKLLKHIAWNTRNIFAADIVTIYECIESKDQVHVLARPAIAGRLLEESKMYTAVGSQDAPALLVAHGKNVFAENSPENDEILCPKRPESTRKPFIMRECIQSVAGIPLKVPLVSERTPSGFESHNDRQEKVGILFINYRCFHHFSDEEKELIDTLAATAAIAIRNRRRLEIYQAVEDPTILAKLDVKEVLGQIVSRAVTITGAQFGEIRLPNAEAQFVPQAEAQRASAKEGIEQSRGACETVANLVKSNRSFVLVNDLETDQLFAQLATKRGSALGGPLLDREGRVLGVLAVAHSEPWELQRYQPVLDFLAKLAAGIIQGDENWKNLKADEKVSMLAYAATGKLHSIYSKSSTINIRAKELEATQALSSEDAERIEGIKRDATELAEVVENLKLVWAENEPQLIDVQQIIDIAWQKVAVPPRLNLDRQFHLVKPLAQVRAYKNQLIEVFANLLQNAMIAMKDQTTGQVLISGRSHDMQDELWVVVRIEDTGEGIKEANRVGELEQSSKAEKGRMHFATYHARSFIERLGGRITWTSAAQGKGTIVTVSLPACVAQNANPGENRS
jgi:GAF domain-containing protein